MTIPNEMILASAGSGKTWQLTNRFIAIMGQQLLAGKDVTPERIVAVTFTRKAAGEFFASILFKLAKAAADADFAAKLAGDEKLDPEAKDDPLSPILRALKSEHYQQLLRIFIARMPRLFLGTLDSFFSAISPPGTDHPWRWYPLGRPRLHRYPGSSDHRRHSRHRLHATKRSAADD